MRNLYRLSIILLASFAILLTGRWLLTHARFNWGATPVAAQRPLPSATTKSRESIAPSQFELLSLPVTKAALAPVASPQKKLTPIGLETLQRPYSADHPNRTPNVTCTVTSAADSGTGSLRECLSYQAAGDTILFDTTVFPPGSPVTISLSTELPSVFYNSITIDGSNAGVIIDGEVITDGIGLMIVGDSATVRGMQMVNFDQIGIALIGSSNSVIGGDRSLGNGPIGQGNLISGSGLGGLWFEGAGTTQNTALGNIIGLEADGATAWPNMTGVVFLAGAHHNTIGGGTADTRNIVSGNSQVGIQVQDPESQYNEIAGNLIGTNLLGTAAVGNLEGVVVIDGQQTIIGGATAAKRNIISGNLGAGVDFQGEDSTDNKAIGNYIGTNVSGNSSIPNLAGAVMFLGAHRNTIGGSVAGEGNLISGNDADGIQIVGLGTDNNKVEGNLIGTNRLGTTAVPNINGITIFDGTTGNIVGGSTEGQRNIISGNETLGIMIQGSGTSNNAVLNNYIGTDITGLNALPNEQGVAVNTGATNNQVGNLGAMNLISANSLVGIAVQGFGTSSVTIQNNLIGTDKTGLAALGNAQSGILVDNLASNVIIGGNSVGMGNVVSGNGGVGILIQQLAGNVQIKGNMVGVNISGTAAIGNDFGIGLAIAFSNSIGGTTTADRNVIGGNTHAGIQIQSSAFSNVIEGNHIGVNISGTAAIGNEDGVVIIAGATDNTIGGSNTAARNIISGNSDSGITLVNSGTNSNMVFNNYIGTNISGTASIPNENGVRILDGAQQNQIGSNTAGNLISGNKPIDGCCGYGVWIDGSGTSSNTIIGNTIGSNSTNSAVLSNDSHGIYIANNATANIIGPDNLVRYNKGDGVNISGVGTINNTITQNRIYQNDNSEIAIDPPPISPPTVRLIVEPKTLEGTVCANCTVEIYGASSTEPSGEAYLLTTVADGSGFFQVTDTSLNSWAYLSIIETNSTGFSKGFLIPTEIVTLTPTNMPSHTPTNTLTPTNTNTPTPTSTGTITVAPTTTYTHTPTPTNTSTNTPTPTSTPTLTPSATPTNTNTPTPEVGVESCAVQSQAFDYCLYLPMITYQ